MANDKEHAFAAYRSYLRGRRLVVAVLAMVLVLAMTAVAYAATDGQLFQMVRVWINGQEIDASTCINEDGSITVGIDSGDVVTVDSGDVSYTTTGEEMGAGEDVDLSVTVLPVEMGEDQEGPYVRAGRERLDRVDIVDSEVSLKTAVEGDSSLVEAAGGK